MKKGCFLNKNISSGITPKLISYKLCRGVSVMFILTKLILMSLCVRTAGYRCIVQINGKKIALSRNELACMCAVGGNWGQSAQLLPTCGQAPLLRSSKKEATFLEAVVGASLMCCCSKHR